MKSKILLLVIFALFSIKTFSQKGKLQGLITDSENNEPLMSVNITVENSTIGTSSDFDGLYEMDLMAGLYTISYNYIGYKKTKITDITIKNDEVISVNVRLGASADELDEIVITTTRKRNTEVSMLTFQKKSINLVDGITAQNFKKIGASNIASAIKSVPGVTVKGGKYVYVRGLGDRYTKTLLNGIDIPGLDPDKNTIQLDLFPTSIVDNILVIKSFTADLQADFTGGIINIITKEYPSKKEYNLSIGGSYNSNMHFNANYLTYEGGKTDFLGFDDGTRELPINPNQSIPNTFDNNPELTNITRKFNPILASKKENSKMDYSFGFSIGNQLTIGENENKLGYFASFGYKNSTKFYESAQNNVYRKDPNNTINELPLSKSQIGALGQNNVILSGLFGISLKKELSKYKLNLMRIQNGESSSGLFRQKLNESDFITFKKDNLEYTQREITNILLSGTHNNEDASWKTVWKLASTFSGIEDKDIRTTAFQDDEGIFSMAQNNLPKRIWRDLQEQNHVGKLDFIKKYELKEKTGKLKFGLSASFKQRDFSIYTIQLGVPNSTIFLNGNANNLLLENNLWTPTNDGIFIANTSIIDPTNIFDANQLNFAGYVSNEYKITENLKSVLGLRVENFTLNYSGENTQGVVLNDKTIIDKLDLFPSINIIYSLNENKNIRLSYARTTARPSFKEASTAEIFDALSNKTFIGNTNIKPTYINNGDLRFEFFGEKAQLFAISGFYKDFRDPIEITFSRAALNDFTPKNLGSAKVYGAEIEIRKNLGFVSTSLENLKIKFNASVIESALKIGEDEMILRQNTARVGEKVSDTRTLQGQSPYLINAGLDYDNEEIGLQTGLYYNVQGKTLEVVGGSNPDVFTLPFHSLNYTLIKKIGKTKKSSISIKVSNILREEKESVYQSFQAQDQIFSKRKQGTSFSISYSVKF